MPPRIAHNRPAKPRSTFAETVAAVVAKDLRGELRARQAVPLAVVFGLLVVVLFRFAVPASIGGLGPGVVGPALLPGALWISLVFGTTLGLGRSADAETHWGASSACVLACADPGALFLGKWLGGLLLGTGIAAVLAMAAVVFMNAAALPVAPLGAITLLGLAGWIAAATLAAALVAGSRSREALAPLILLPLAAPLLIATMGATSAAVAGQPWAELAPALGLIAAYDVIFLVAAFLPYGYVLEVSA
jgi:ABC-type transport system involved in cytochrome c biogenesis permease component